MTIEVCRSYQPDLRHCLEALEALLRAPLTNDYVGTDQRCSEHEDAAAVGKTAAAREAPHSKGNHFEDGRGRQDGGLPYQRDRLRAAR
jgi:hypothetical protein